MWTTEDQTVAAGHSVDDVDPVRWQALLDELLGRVAGRFARADLRRRARAFVRGLLADLPRKNCWTIAEHAGNPSPDGMQHLLARAVWDHDQVGFATKPALATKMLTRALDAEVPAAWVASDEVYGANPGLRAELQARQIGYVLAVACDHRVGFGGTTQRADALLGQVPARAWQQIACGKGAKGHRLYDWAFIRLDHDGPAPGRQAGQHWLMVRRNQRTGELAYYHCWMPRPVPLAVLVKVAGQRWTVEHDDRELKDALGLDHFEGRSWQGWHHHVTLVSVAHGF